MTCNLLMRKALSSGLMVAIIATYSMVTLAGNGRIAGDLTVLGTSSNAAGSVVLVNGEAAKSGRSIFSSSTIKTPDGVSAVISVNNAGRLEIAPNSTFTFTADANTVGGILSEGKVSVINSVSQVLIDTPAGPVTLNAGEAATAAGRQDDDDDDNGGAAWWLFAIGLGGAAAGILYAVLKDSNNAELGGGGTVISPVR